MPLAKSPEAEELIKVGEKLKFSLFVIDESIRRILYYAFSLLELY